jgi:hypothetical protein
MGTTTFQVIEIAGVLSIVLTLLFVAYQIRRTNQIAVVTAEMETRNNYSGLNEAMAGNKDLAILVEKTLDSAFQPEQGEETQLRSLAFRFMNIWLASEVAFKHKMLPQASFSVVLDDIRYTVAYSRYFRGILRLNLDNYPGWCDTAMGIALRAELESYDDAEPQLVVEDGEAVSD